MPTAHQLPKWETLDWKILDRVTHSKSTRSVEGELEQKKKQNRQTNKTNIKKLII